MADDSPQDAKPVKPDDDLVAYIRQLQIPLEEAVAAVTAGLARTRSGANPGGATSGGASSSSSGGDGAPLSLSSVIAEDQSILIGSVHREIKKRQASLATHKLCSFIVEALVVASPAHLVAHFLHSLIPYTGFLSTNRFGTHVLSGME